MLAAGSGGGGGKKTQQQQIINFQEATVTPSATDN